MNTPDLDINSDFSRFRPEEIDSLNRYVEQLNARVRGERGASEVMATFPRYVRTMDLTRFLVTYEVFRKITSVQGSIVELGVLHGFNIFSFAHLSEIFEHRNYVRRIYGFDTFDGYPTDFNPADRIEPGASTSGWAATSLSEMTDSVAVFDTGRVFKQFEKITLIQGDARDTIPQFVDDNPNLIVSLLVCNLDLYEATKVAIESFYPRMPRGSVILFGSTNTEWLPGETVALQETLGIGAVQLERFPFATKWSFCVK